MSLRRVGKLVLKRLVLGPRQRALGRALLQHQKKQEQQQSQTASRATAIRLFSSSRVTTTTTIAEKEKLVSILEDRDLLAQIPLEDVRNFCFIAHIDHGKSSLSSRVLELCGNLGPDAQKQAWEAATGEVVETTTDSASGMGSSSTQSNNNNNNNNNNKERIEALDTLSVEQERGITVKASTATMLYKHPAAVGPTGTLLLNMYDTPGQWILRDL